MTRYIVPITCMVLLAMFAERATSQNGDESDTNVVRFMGNGAYVSYNFQTFAQKYPQMVEYTKNETFSFNFTTSQADGLIYMNNRTSEQLYIAFINGDLVFVFDDHVRPASVTRIHSRTNVTNWTWHSFKVVRYLQNLKFFLDTRFITEVNMHKEIQFVTASNVYLGGAPGMTSLTSGRVTSSFDGALTLVEYMKSPSARIHIQISLLRYIHTAGTRHGEFRIYKQGESLSGTEPTTTPERMRIIDVISLQSTYVHIPGRLDLRSGGTISFRFRTFDTDGIIFFTERIMRELFAIFCAFEVFDGKLYMVYNLGRGVKRVAISGSDVSTGDSHDVELTFRQGNVVIQLDQADQTLQLTAFESNQLYFDQGLYIAGLPARRDYPGFIWSRRGYNGCFSNLNLDRRTTSIPGPVTVTEKAGAKNSCQISTYCTASACVHGRCHSRIGRFVCKCEGTGYQGTTCSETAVIGGFHGDMYLTFRFSSSITSAVNDFSLRFYTLLEDAFLFQTEADRKDEYIRGELENGRLKITFYMGGKTKVIHTGYYLNDYTWHTLYVRRRGRSLDVWVDSQSPTTGALDSDYPSFTIDALAIGGYKNGNRIQGYAPFHGYLQSVYVGGWDVFSKLQQRQDINFNWYRNVTSSQYLSIPMLNPMTVMSKNAYMTLALTSSRRPLHILFKFRTRQQNGVILFSKDATSMFFAVELVVGHVMLRFNNRHKTFYKRIPRRIDDNEWHDVEIRQPADRSSGKSWYTIRVDNVTSKMSIYSFSVFNVMNYVVVGGLPADISTANGAIYQDIHSTNGFIGCLASVYINSVLIDASAANHQLIRAGSCQDDIREQVHEEMNMKTIRVTGSGSYVYYRFLELAELYPDVTKATNNETFSVRFITRQPDGLIWMDRRHGQILYLALKNGHLMFVIDNGTGSPHVINLDSQRIGDLNDNRWHDFKVVRAGRHLQFYVDNILIIETEPQEMVQFASDGEVYIGGTPDTPGLTRGQINVDYNGRIEGVRYMKGSAHSFVDILSSIETKGRLYGSVSVFNATGHELIITKAPTSSPQNPANPTVLLIPQGTFRSAAWKIGRYIDLRSNGYIGFSFKTFDRRGLIWYTKSLNSDVYLGLELFDGKLYMLYKFGQGDSRRQISSGTVNNGQSTRVTLTAHDGLLTTSVGGHPVQQNVNQTKLNFDNGQYISGLPSYPSFIWSSEGFNGCLRDLVMTVNVTDLKKMVALPENNPRIRSSCMLRDPCERNPCIHGTCYSSMDQFECDCTATSFTGPMCSEVAVGVGFDGSGGITYRKQTTQKTKVNNMAVRFKTIFPNSTLFQTFSNTSEDFIKGELMDGILKITVYKDGKSNSYLSSSHLNDNTWHNMFVQRRADRLEIWIDQRPHTLGTLKGDNFNIDISGFRLGTGTTTTNANRQTPRFIGYMQNVYFDEIDTFSRLHTQPITGISWYNTTPSDSYDPLIFDPITLPSRAAYLELGTLPAGTALNIRFKFRTGQENGLLLFNEGRNGEFIAVEMVNGVVYFVCNSGENTSTKLLKKNVDDNNWHTFYLRGASTRQYRRVYQVGVDHIEFSVPIQDELETTRPVFLGGLPKNMYISNAVVKTSLKSTNGFIGCLASVFLNVGKPDLNKYSREGGIVLQSCKDIKGFCPAVDPCQHGGRCSVGVENYQCDCDQTGYSGLRCQSHPRGIYFGEHGRPGVISYTMDQAVTTDQDDVVFGFMTRRPHGVLARMESVSGNEYIDIHLIGGNLVATYDIGAGKKVLTLDDRRLDDGKYHVVHFLRNASGAALRVDGSGKQIHSATKSNFNQLKYIFLGGRQGTGDDIVSAYYGLLGDMSGDIMTCATCGAGDAHSNREGTDLTFGICEGFYYNRMGVIEEYVATNGSAGFGVYGDISLIGNRNYVLIPRSGNNGSIIYLPSDIGGGGVAGRSYGESKEIFIGDGVNWGTDGSGGMTDNALAQRLSAAAMVPLLTRIERKRPRAGALLGIILGTLAFAASLMWALWQCKPGLILPCCGHFDLNIFGLEGGPSIVGGGSGDSDKCSGTSAKVCGDVIAGGVSAACASQLKVSSLSEAKSISGCDEDDGYVTAKHNGGGNVSIVNGDSTTGEGGAGFTAAYSTTGNSSALAAGGGQSSCASSTNQSLSKAAGADSSVFYSSTSGVTISNGRMQEGSSLTVNESMQGSSWDMGTMKSTTCLIDSGTMKSTTSMVGGGSSSYSQSVSTSNKSSSNSATIGGSGGMAGYVDSSTADYDFPMGYNESCSNYNASNTLSTGYSSSTISSSYKYQGGTLNQFGQQMCYSPLAVTPGAAGEEVRVDCCYVTGDGSSVVTESSLGPPQVWNMETGELLRIMKGDTVGSSSLHLACNDSLLVGTVLADLDVNAFSIGKGVTHKKLQVWNFVTGRPLEMGPSGTCSALCLTADKDKAVFARSDKFGNGTTFTVWDLVMNHAIKELRYDAPVGNNDYVNFLSLSYDDKFCVAGYTNSFDNQIEFLSFDIALTNSTIENAKILKLDAFSDCTVLLLRDEAVTGLRNGSLVVWSLRTGQVRRHLLSGSEYQGHDKEITALALSQDKKFLVSASSDKTLKIWDMDREQLTRTLIGHTDEVWCTDISKDCEVIVSGSRDGSIRLWRLDDGSEICAFSTGIDVFYVTMSHDRGTIVALGDKYSARKLIMLQVVRTKIQKEIAS